MSEAFELSVQGQFFRVQPPEPEPPLALLLAIHGVTGDEFSMEIFTRKLRQRFYILYPRAPYSAPGGGYSWVAYPRGLALLETDYAQAAQMLNQCLERLSADLGTPHLPIYTLGFSQGAALALVYSVMFARPHEKHALLAGFLPSGLTCSPGALRQRSFFIAHGSRDETVPIAQAQRTIEFLKQSGAETQFCQSDTTHKIGLECLRKLEAFFTN